MRVLRFLSALCLTHFLHLMPAHAADAPALIAQAIELLQTNEKAKALKLLEKAFESAQDPEMVKEAAVLIIQASPENYSKREAYLRYLTQRNRDHEDGWKWFKELGDRAFDRGDFNQSEEYYLNAQTHSPDSFLIKYKLAWTYWNQKRRNEAMSVFLDLSLLAHTGSNPDTDSLRDQLKRDIARLWWETGPMPAATYAKIFNGPEDYQNQIFSELWTAFPKDSSPAPKLIELLKQIRDDARSSGAWREFLARDLYFKPDPCFMMANVYGPENFASSYTLLACAKDTKRPELEALQRHFDRLMPEADENFARAYARVLQDAHKPEQAILVLTLWSGFEGASAETKELVGKIMGTLEEDAFATVASQIGRTRLEGIASTQKDSALMHRLQKLDPDHWIPFEEILFAAKKPSRDFLLKKASWLARDYMNHRSEIEDIVSQVMASPKTAEEKAVKTALNGLEQNASTEIPKTFSDKLTKSLNTWIQKIDRDMANYQMLSSDWQTLVSPLVQEKLQRNIDQLSLQLDSVEMPADAPTELVDAFAAKKLEIKTELQNKYSSFLRPS